MMNPFDWEDSVRRWPGSMDTHQKDSGRVENTPGTHGSRSHYQHTADTVHDPPNRLTVQSGPAGHCPSTNNFPVEKAEPFDPDGKSFDTDQEDHDLTRKLKELRKIEESIRCKEVAIACKTVLKPSLGASDGELDRCSGPTLKDRVNAILQQRQPNSFLSKSHFHKRRVKSSGPSKDEKQQEDHPLKVRVKVLMKHRMSRPCDSPSNAKPPPQRMVSSPAEESSVDQGFQRFLDVLNKGVDVNLLRRIVNEDSEGLCLDDKVQDNQQHKATESPCRSKSQYSNDVISLPEHSRSGERSTDPRSQERPQSNPIPDNGEKKEEALSPCRSKTSSDSLSGLKYKKEDGDRIKHDEQHEQLQNILTSLGLQLEVEEISKLANRTQERLYGKKTDNVNAESRQEPDRQPRHSPRSNRSCSSSSSSCSSSSRSSSQSRSSSSSSCGSSQSKASGRRRRSESSSSRERSSEKLTRQGNHQHGDKRPKAGSEEDIQFRERPSYTQNQTCPPPNPSYSFPPLPDDTLDQYSQYSTYSSSPYQDAMSSSWTYSQAPIHPSFYPSSHPYTQDQCPQFPIAVLERTRGLTRPGQMAQPLNQRCLLAIHRNPITNCMEGKRTNKKAKKMQKLQNRKNAVCRKQKRTKGKLKRAAEKAEEEVGGAQQPAPKKEEQAIQVEKSQSNVALHHNNSKAKNVKKREHQLSEEEIKANLRKTLEAFNRKVKQGVKQPISSLTCQTDEDLLMKL